ISYRHSSLWFQKRVRNARRPRSKRGSHFGENRPPIQRALSHRAWTSTGLPIRGVTTQSPTLASIQVSATPGTPAARSLSLSRRCGGGGAAARLVAAGGEGGTGGGPPPLPSRGGNHEPR